MRKKEIRDSLQEGEKECRRVLTEKKQCDNLDDNQKQLRKYQKKVKKVISVNLNEKRIYKKSVITDVDDNEKGQLRK